MSDGRCILTDVPTIDFHAHAFPDSLSGRAVSRIRELSGIQAVLDGRVSTLVDSMDAAGIRTSVLLSIATKPSQFESIFEWSKGISSDRIVPFPSVHPADPDAVHKVRICREEGFKGMKFHPYYQDFELDSERMFPIYEALEKEGLICICHTGFDHAFPFTRTADPPRIVKVVRKFPGLTFVATHLGAWRDWDTVAEHLPKERLFVDIAYSLEFLPPEKARGLILSFRPDRLLFGSDSPWGGQANVLGLLSGLSLEEGLSRAILHDNARKLLGT